MAGRVARPERPGLGMRAVLDAGQARSWLRMESVHPSRSGWTFCLTEGSSDRAFYRRATRGHDFLVHCCGGRSVVLDVVGQVADPRLIGVVDADHWWLARVRPPQRIAVTPERDLDVHLVVSPSAWDDFAADYVVAAALGTCERALGTDLRSWALREVRPLGLLRWFNEQRGLGLRFSAVALADHLDATTLRLDLGSYVAALLAGRDCALDLHAEIARLARICGPVPHHAVVQGHDLTDAIAWAGNLFGVLRDLPDGQAVTRALRGRLDSFDFQRSAFWEGILRVRDDARAGEHEASAQPGPTAGG